MRAIIIELNFETNELKSRLNSDNKNAFKEQNPSWAPVQSSGHRESIENFVWL